MATIDKPLPNVDNDKAQEEIVEIENKKAAEVIICRCKIVLGADDQSWRDNL